MCWVSLESQTTLHDRSKVSVVLSVIELLLAYSMSLGLPTPGKVELKSTKNYVFWTNYKMLSHLKSPFIILLLGLLLFVFLCNFFWHDPSILILSIYALKDKNKAIFVMILVPQNVACCNVLIFIVVVVIFVILT